MEHIYHEKQEGSLCAQHCLNNLLQEQIFSAIDLSEIGKMMDQEERKRMAEQGLDTEEFKKFLEQPSTNMDDSGMFSVQVLSQALDVYGLRLVNYGSSSNNVAQTAREYPAAQNSFICNFREHWFTIRKLGLQWFNLNSLLTYPELISDTYLSLFLKQLEHEGYSIFIVDGALPPCNANDALLTSRAIQTTKPKLLSEVQQSNTNSENVQLKKVLAASLLKAQGSSVPLSETRSSSEDLQAAIQMSLGNFSSLRRDPSNDENSSDEDIKCAIAMSLEASGQSTDNSPSRKSLAYPGTSLSQSHKTAEDEELDRALQLSLDATLCSVESPENLLDVDEIRKRRLDYLSKRHP